MTSKIIHTTEELLTLPAESVVLTSKGGALQRFGNVWYPVASNVWQLDADVRLPVTLIHEGRRYAW